MSRNTWIWIGLLLLAFVAGDWFASRRNATNATIPASSPATSTAPRETPVPLPRSQPASIPDASGLPAEARDTLARIAAGGPFEHRQDGSVFQNRERQLPSRPRGWYHEYTVETPGSDDRGAAGERSQATANRARTRTGAGTRSAVPAAAATAAGREVNLRPHA